MGGGWVRAADRPLLADFPDMATAVVIEPSADGAERRLSAPPNSSCDGVVAAVRAELVVAPDGCRTAWFGGRVGGGGHPRPPPPCGDSTRDRPVTRYKSYLIGKHFARGNT
jgi:hypothetical protein